MAMGIELVFNMSTNNALFNKGVKSASQGIVKFYEQWESNLTKVASQFNFSDEAASKLRESIQSTVPILVDINNLSSGDQFLLNSALNGANEILKQLNSGFQNFFGEALDSSKMQELNSMLMEIDQRNFSNLGDSLEKFNNELVRFSPKQQKLYIDLLEELRNAETVEEVESLTKQLKKITDLPMQDVVDHFQNIKQGIQRTLRLGLGLTSLEQIFSEIMSVQTELARTTWQMGQVSSDAFNNVAHSADGALKANYALRKDVRNATADFMSMNRTIASKTQTSLSEVGNTMNELMQMRVGNLRGDFEELATTSMMMQKALGLSSSAANQFVRDLSLIGGVGAEEVHAAAQELSNVQQNLGLTGAEAQLVGATVGKLMRQFRTFGGSARDVAAVTSEVGKMTAAFSSVGLAAEDAQEIIMNMMNPDNLQKSVLLWSSMGMSAAEGFAMMHGEGQNMVGMTEKMVHVAKNLKTQYGQNIFALKAMAEAHGLSLEQVQALSQYDSQRLRNMQKQAKLEEAAAAARQGLNDQLRRLKDQLMVILQSVLLPALRVIGTILEPVIQLLAWINRQAEEGSVIMKIIASIIKAGIIAGLLSIMGILPKILSLSKGLGAVFGGIKDKISGFLGKFTKSASTITKQGRGGSKAIASMGKAFKSWPNPAKILALGAAMLMIAGGIALIILSVTQLVKAVGKANLSFGQLAGIALMLLPIFAGFIGIMWALPPVIAAIGAASSGAAVGLLAFGFAMLMLAGGIALIVLSLAKLIEAFSTLAGPQILGALGALVVIFAGLIAVLIVMAAIGATVGWALLAVGAAMLMLGAGVALVGVGIKMIVDAFTNLATNIIPLLLEAFLSIGENAGQIALSLVVLAGSALLFVAAAALMIIGALGFVAAIALMIPMIPFLFLIGLAAWKAGQAFMNMGIGIKLIAENFSAALAGLKEFKEVLSGKWKGIADQVVQEIERINEKLSEMQRLTMGALAATIVTNVMGKIIGEDESAKDASTIDYTSQLNQANSHLLTISQNTNKTNALLGQLIQETKKAGRIRTQFTLTSNTGA